MALNKREQTDKRQISQQAVSQTCQTIYGSYFWMIKKVHDSNLRVI